MASFPGLVGYDIFTPTKSTTLATKDYTDPVFTADELFTLYLTDAYVEKTLHAQTIEALRYWVKVTGGKDPSEAYKADILQAVDWARLFGFSIITFMDTNPQLGDPLEEGFDGYRIKSYHIKVTGLPGIVRWDLDANNYPTNFYIKVSDVGQEIKIDASRVVVFSNNWKTGHWRGITDLSNVLADLNGMRKQRSSLSDRADQYPVAGAVISTTEDVTDDDQLAAQDAFDPISVLLVKNGSVSPLGGLLSPTELETAISELKESVIVGTGYAKSDVTGAQAGEKLSEDKNRDMKSVRYQVIQLTFENPVMKVFEKLGLTWNGWAEPDELNKSEKVTTIVQLSNAFNNASDEGIRTIIANLALDIFKKEAQGVTINTEIEEVETDVSEPDEREPGKQEGASNKRRWFNRK